LRSGSGAPERRLRRRPARPVNRWRYRRRTAAAAVFLRTVRDFNAACRTDVPFNPNVLDGRCTVGLVIDKTNWTNPLDTPPFHA
jgi:tricarballylate dehydrogenase